MERTASRFPLVQWKPIEAFIQSVDSKTIPPSLRMALASDGILTTALESLFLSPIEIELIRQEESVVDETASEFLQVEAGIPALVREVWLKSRRTPVLFASSVIPLDGLSRALLRKLKEDPKPLGILLHESGRPTLKVRLEAGRIDDSSWAGNPGFPPDASLWARRYRLEGGEKHAIFIQEIINETPFQDHSSGPGKPVS